MNKFLLALLLLPLAAFAQQTEVVSSCGGVTLHSGDNARMYVDTSGNLCSSATSSGGTVSLAPSSSSASGLPPVVSSAAESSHVLKSSAGNLYGLCVTNGAAAGYVMIFNATSAPADGAVTPVNWFAMPATTSTACYDPGVVPDYLGTGITAVYSTTGPFTKTASATAAFSGKVK